MNDADPGKVVAFYSYKGGTGQSMALANVGCALVSDQRSSGQVLMVDWDLEAPGLHRYFRKHVVEAFNGDEDAFDKTPGLIDLFIDLRGCLITDSDTSKLGENCSTTSSVFDKFTLTDFIIETDIPRLHLLKAGRFDRDYASKVATYNWPALYDRSPHLLRALLTGWRATMSLC